MLPDFVIAFALALEFIPGIAQKTPKLAGVFQGRLVGCDADLG
jgi:hypothetical protein